MDKQTHTPGPWTVRATPESSNQDFIVCAGRHQIAPVQYSENSEADATLIAAAPDLLAALRSLLDALPSATTHPAIKTARAAIAKVEGES